MHLRVEFDNNVSADGAFTVQAPGYDEAVLYWADKEGALQEWTAFGHMKLDPATGEGVLKYGGGRSAPAEATHVCVRACCTGSSDFGEELFPMERRHLFAPGLPLLRLGVMTDIHLTKKVGTVKWAMRNIEDADAVLLPGDMANNGSEAEFQLFEGCLDEMFSGVPVFSVNGNHDLMSGPDQYAAFQKRRISWQTEVQNIGYASWKGVDVIGINAGALWTSDMMRITADQLSYLEDLLERGRSRWKIILCHTPLSRNIPVRNGRPSNYLSKSAHLQRIMDAHDHIIFLSGHTHLSPSLAAGVVHFEEERNNLYINCGSIRPTELDREAEGAPAEWKEGITVELRMAESAIEIRMRTVHSRKWVSRGYYVLPVRGYSEL